MCSSDLGDYSDEFTKFTISSDELSAPHDRMTPIPYSDNGHIRPLMKFNPFSMRLAWLNQNKGIKLEL